MIFNILYMLKFITMKSHILLLILLLGFAFSGMAQATYTYTDNGSGATYTLAANESLLIESGVFTGTIQQLPASATIYIASGATFAPTALLNASGLLKNNGTILFNQTHSLNNGFSIINEINAELSINAVQAMTGSISITNLKSSLIRCHVDLTLAAGSTFSNDGIANFQESFSIGATSTLSNDGVMTVNNNFTTSGIMYNSGILKVYGQAQLEADARVINKCTFLCKQNLTNNSAKFENYGYIQVFGTESNYSFVNNQEFFNDAKGVLELVNFENNSVVSGGGKFHVSGTSSNNGSFGYDGGSILFYDATIIGTQMFDNQVVAPHVSVYREEIGANDTTYISANCNKIAFPIAPNAPLPVVLDQFTASNKDCTPTLEWSTLQEINSSYFEIERKSSTENQFTTLGKVNAQINSALKTDYTYADQKLENGLYHYRLKMVDLDGNFSYSRVTSLNMFCGNTSEINVYPNPSQGEVNITLQTNDDDVYQVALVDMMGRSHFQGTYDFSNGLNTIKLNLGSLPTGNYNVVITNTITTQRVKLTKN